MKDQVGMLLLLTLLASIGAELQEVPKDHLTPPAAPDQTRAQREISPPKDNTGSFTQKLASWFSWNTQDKRPYQADQHSKNQGRHNKHNLECNPCNKVPWVPVARAIGSVPAVYNDNVHQYSLQIPTIDIGAIPLQYGPPNGGGIPPKPQYGPPKPDYGPPKQEYGPPKPEYGPPKPEYGPPKPDFIPPKPEYGPPKPDIGQPKPDFGPPKPEYGPPKQEYGPPKQEHGPPKPDYSPPKPEYGPPKPEYRPSNPDIIHIQDDYSPLPPLPSTLNSYGPPSADFHPPGPNITPPKPDYGPPKSNHGPPQPNHGSAQPNHGPPQPNYGPPQPNHGPPQPNYGPPQPNHGPPQPNYGPPQPNYGPPQPNFGPSRPSGGSPPDFGPPPKPFYGPPKANFGPPKPGPSPDYGPPKPGYGPPRPGPPHGLRQGPRLPPPVYQSPSVQHGSPDGYQQFLTPPPQRPSDSYKSLGSNLPFPHMSRYPVPPIFNHQQFNPDASLPPYLEPPKQQSNVIFTISETGENCNKCPSGPDLSTGIPEGQRDSIPEVEDVKSAIGNFGELPLSDSTQEGSSLTATHNNPPSTNIEVTKSVPLKEFLSSVEYPMQIIHAPIVDVPGLPKYFNLGYHSFNQQVQGKIKGSDQHNSNPQTIQDSEKASSIPQQAVSNPGNELPHNHKGNKETLIIHHGPSTVRYLNGQEHSGPASSGQLDLPVEGPSTPPSSTVLHSTQIPTIYGSGSSFGPGSESSHHDPRYFHQFFNTSTSSQQSNSYHPGTTAVYNPTQWGPPHSVPTLGSPRPFLPPSPTPKKKHIHQIIVPYTTVKKQTRNPQDPGSNMWVQPPVNQARKVPPNIGDKQPDLQAIYVNRGVTAPENDKNRFPLTAQGSENHETLQLSDFEGAQILKSLPPELMNKLLQAGFEPSKSSPTSQVPGNVKHILATNIRALLRGEEDSVDIVRLQKNIDKWTAEGYGKGDSDINAIKSILQFKSKKIPEEYLTTPTSITEHRLNTGDALSISDHEVAASQHYPVRTLKFPKEIPKPKINDTELVKEVNGWALIETKMAPTTTMTPMPWEKLQVSISPLTKEKVYVVTPLPTWPSGPEESTTPSMKAQDRVSHAQDEEEEPTTTEIGQRITRGVGLADKEQEHGNPNLLPGTESSEGKTHRETHQKDGSSEEVTATVRFLGSQQDLDRQTPNATST